MLGSSLTTTTPATAKWDARRLSAIAPAPTSAANVPEVLRRAFRAEVSRVQRWSDGTVSLKGQRFEVPSRFAHIKRVQLRYARWDLSSVDLVDSRSGAVLSTLYPLDKAAHASGERRSVAEPDQTAPPQTGEQIPPLLKKLLADFAATGLPPPYLPEEDQT